jgi:DNA-binding PadR family transcriptional regulator
MSNGKLTPTSYVVLGVVALLGRATSYDMKRLVGISIGYFWTFPHSQLYAEPDRLVKMGLLEEQQEEGGRRRRVYTITEAGREELKDWLADPETPPIEMRDAATLKLFFGNLGAPENVRKLAEKQIEATRELMEEHEKLHAMFEGVTGLETQLATLRLGDLVLETCDRFWREIAETPPGESREPSEPL